MSAGETLDAIRLRLLPMLAQHSEAWARLRDALAEQGIRIVGYDERPERHLELRRQFLDEIFPVLTPLAVDPGHPFPYISDLSLVLAVTVRDPSQGEPLCPDQGAAGVAALVEVAPAHVRTDRADHRRQPRRAFRRYGDRRAPPLPRHPQRRPVDRGGRGARPAAGDRGRSCAAAASAKSFAWKSSAPCRPRRAAC
jgi:hypothetical protein